MNLYSTHAYKSIEDFWFEPDHYEGCAYGLPFVCIRNDMKAWCGYVGVPFDHPAAGKEPFYVGPHPATLADLNNPENFRSIEDLQVHGGITWDAPYLPDKSRRDRYWLGFDCVHAWDRSPLDAFKELAGEEYYLHSSRKYRPLTYVIRECFRLAEQLSDLTSGYSDSPLRSE